MNDLVGRLRMEARRDPEIQHCGHSILSEAADRIGRLEAALKVIAECENPESNHPNSVRANEMAKVYFESVRAVARTALGDEQQVTGGEK